MSAIAAVLPVLAAGFAVPQFIPQIVKLGRTGDTLPCAPCRVPMSSGERKGLSSDC